MSSVDMHIMLLISDIMAQFIECPNSSGAKDDLVVVVPRLYLMHFYLPIIFLNASKVTTRGVVNASRLNICKFFLVFISRCSFFYSATKDWYVGLRMFECWQEEIQMMENGIMEKEEERTRQVEIIRKAMEKKKEDEKREEEEREKKRKREKDVPVKKMPVPCLQYLFSFFR